METDKISGKCTPLGTSDAAINITVSASGKVITLKLRFIKSELIYIEKIIVNDGLLGLTSGMLAEGRLTYPFKELFLDETVIYGADEWDKAQKDFNEFVQNNCFHGSEKPVNRIERVPHASTASQFFFDGGNSPVFTHTTPEQLKELLSDDFEIYEDKPCFTSNWKRIAPISDEMMEVPTVVDRIGAGSARMAALHVAKTMSDQYSALMQGIEIWEFTVWSK